MNLPRLHVIACAIFRRELEALAAGPGGRITFHHLGMGLHEGSSENHRAALQEAVDQAEAVPCDAVAIAYGLCNRGIVGLQARSRPLVIPRAHDCIGILLGNSRSYLAQLEAQPGTYFQSAGWLENSPAKDAVRLQNSPLSPSASMGRDEFVAKYGEDNADYLIAEFARIKRHYQRLAFIATPVPQAERWEAEARQTARKHGWTFERLPGDLGWLRRLIGAEWDDREFLQLKPGQRVCVRHDSLLIGVEPP